MSPLRTTPLTSAELDHYRTEGWVTLGRMILDDATLEAIRTEEARFRGDPAGQYTLCSEARCSTTASRSGAS